MLNIKSFTRRGLLAAWASLLVAPAFPDDSAPVVEHSKTGSALENLPRRALADRVAVTIYQFRSGAGGIDAAAATDIFTTALIQSGQFRVVERAQLGGGLIYEKQLNGAGQSTGEVAQQKLRGAQYIFEGTVSEASASVDQRQSGISIGGLSFGGGRNKNKIAIDVRIVDAGSGDVLDSVAVSKALTDTNSGVGGTAALAGTLASMAGKDVNPLTPDVNYQAAHTDPTDAALRACIEAAVFELIKRVQPAPPSGH